MRFLIACCDWRTGGPEALHQLALTLQEAGHDAAIVYAEERLGNLIPLSRNSNLYPEYPEIKIETLKDLDEHTVLVLPEIWSHFALHYTKLCNILVWWLSVDNGLLSIGRISGDWDCFRGHPKIFHAYQSAYAREFLHCLGLNKIDLPLSDFTYPPSCNITNHKFALKSHQYLRISYNPKKGSWLSDLFIKAHPNAEYRAITNMDPDEVKRTIAESDYYIDFGSFPGKDRLPREALQVGTRVFLRSCGDGKRKSDWDLPEECYFSEEDCVTGVLWDALRKDSQNEDLSRWQNANAAINSEKAIFRHECSAMADSIKRQIIINSAQTTIIQGIERSITRADEIKTLSVNCNDLRLKVDQYKYSLSWKLTAPIRKALALIRGVPITEVKAMD